MEMRCGASGILQSQREHSSKAKEKSYLTPEAF